jgi:hypothetical protein
MSVQLIIYPQFFDGQSPLNNYQLEYVVDGVSFLTIDGSDSYTATQSNAILDALTNAPPAIANSWYRFRSSDAGTPSFPENSSNKLKLYKTTTQTKSGVYQRLSNLNVGQTYTLEVTITTGTSDLLFLSVYDGTTIVTQPAFSSAAGTVTTTFTATATDNIIALTYTNTATTSGHILISNIMVQPSVSQTANLSGGQVTVDLYENEDIPLTLSIDDFKNVAEKVQSYSKAFDLPATKRNNKIFDNIFDITRTDTGIVFNPYIKTKCELKQDGFILFEGYLRLIDITDKLGEISYNVNLYSEVIALADFLKEKTFNQIDFTELSHVYNKTNIKYSWNESPNTGITYTESATSGYRDANDTLKYPFVDWEHQFTTDINDNPELLTLGNAFRPWMQIKYLIERIFQDSPFTFESTFFNTTDFKKLYMDFNWGGEKEPHNNQATGTGTNQSTSGTAAGLNTYSKLIFDEETFSDDDLFGYDSANTKFVSQFDNQLFTIDFTFGVTYTGLSSPSTAQTVGNLAWREFDSSNNFINNYSLQNINTFGSGSTTAGVVVSGTFAATLPQGNYLVPMFTRTSAVSTMTQTPVTGTPNGLSDTVITVGNTDIGNSTFADNLRGELKQWEFLKGIMTMFNLVSIPDKDNPNNILIEPYGDVFINNTSGGSVSDLTLKDRGIKHNWTEKVDVSEIKMSPLTNLNKITKFTFVEDEDDYTYMQYKRATTGFMYGSKIFDASGFTVLDGEDDIKAEPFAATAVKPLMPKYNDFIIPSIYSYNADNGESSGFDNSPRICYNVGKKTLTSCTYSIPAQNFVSGSAAEDEFLQFAHLSTVTTTNSTLDFNFGECQLFTGVGNTVTKNLFNLYYLPYFNELYNSDTRTMILKVDLTPGDIALFKLFDTVFLKNREFRVNKIDYKPGDLSIVEFILIP